MATASWRMLTTHGILIAVSVLAYAVGLIAAGVLVFAGLALVRPDPGAGQTPATWLVVVAAGIAATWIASMGQGAIIVSAAARMEGRDPSIQEAFEPVRRRLGALFGWAVIATVVTKVLDLLRRRSGPAGRTAASAGELAWRVVSFLALPVVIFEDAGPVDGLRRSSALLERTWGENVTFNFGLGLLGIALALPVVAGLAIAQAVGALPLSFIGLVPLVLYGLLAIAAYSALSAVLKTALYRWAHDLPVDPSFDGLELGRAFSRR